MSFDFLNPSDRYKIIQEIKGEENKQRKAQSLKQFEIFQDRQHQYVIEYLRQQFSQKTVREMPVISSINLAKRIVTQEASLYKSKPERSWNTEGNELDQIIKHYMDMSIDAKMLKANQVYKLQNQCLLMCVPKNGKLLLRVLYAHHYDVVPDPENPEVALAYIISSFDKQFYVQQFSDTSVANPTGYRPASNSAKNMRDNNNQGIGDPDDYKSSLERYVVWTKDLNFIMDGNGKVITAGDDMASPLAQFQMMPFVDISSDKDFEYFVRLGQAVTDFSVQYCGALSDLGNVVKMQGWAQAYLKGSKELMPENIQIGPNFILKLPIDPNDKVETEFGFANPQPDLTGSISYVEMLLSNFLTSRGMSPKIVSGKGDVEKYSSGVERLLSMIEKFEASKTDMEVFRNAEIKLFDIARAWNNVGLPGDVLDVSFQISDETQMTVKYAEPQAIQSRGEQLDAVMKEMELGLKSRKMAIQEIYGVDEEKAQMMLSEIDASELGVTLNGQDQGA